VPEVAGCKLVGTTERRVGRSLAIASRIDASSKRGKATTPWPATRLRIRMASPPTWWGERVSNQRSGF